MNSYEVRLDRFSDLVTGRYGTSMSKKVITTEIKGRKLPPKSYKHSESKSLRLNTHLLLFHSHESRIFVNGVFGATSLYFIASEVPKGYYCLYSISTRRKMYLLDAILFTVFHISK